MEFKDGQKLKNSFPQPPRKTPENAFISAARDSRFALKVLNRLSEATEALAKEEVLRKASVLTLPKPVSYLQYLRTESHMAAIRDFAQAAQTVQDMDHIVGPIIVNKAYDSINAAVAQAPVARPQPATTAQLRR